jgi:mono/diheme cytochrome c family protein
MTFRTIPVSAIRLATRASMFATAALLAAAVGCSGQTMRPATGTGGSAPPPTSGSAGSAGSGTLPTPGSAGGTVTKPIPDPPMPTATDPNLPASACGSAEAYTDGAAPTIYVSECSSCHGMTADGRNGYPSLRGTLTLAELTTIVRGGRISDKLMVKTAEGKSIPARMPAFSTTRLSDGDIASIYAYRTAAPDAKAPVPAVYCLSRPEASWTPTQIDEAYTRGLKAWRTQGDVDQNACAFCHAADAMDLAFIGYTDGAIYRRAFTHVSQPVVDDVIDMVHALRAKYKIVQPPDPIKYRPFQPGGAVLPGATAAERDKAFGQELKDMGLTIMGAPINTAADAHKAWDEMAGLNLRTLKVGIPMNRYTEDIFNNDGANVTCPDKHLCDDHGTIADWITDVPVLTPATATKLFAAQDAYLADPTLENIKAVLYAAPRDDVMWFKNKFLAVQMANYLFRQQAAGMTMLDKLTPSVPFPVEKGANLNAIWMVGANLRDFIHNVGAALPTGGGKFSVPTATLAGLTRNDASEQLQRVIVPWFWLGFSFDASTMNVEADYVAEGDEYFTQETFLDNNSSPIHGAFIVGKRSIEMMKYDTLPRSPNVFPFSHPDLGRFPVTPMTMRSGYFPVVTNFAEEKNFNTINNYQVKFMPTEPTQKALYQTYAANMWRMFMWVLVDDLQKNPSVWNPTILMGKIKKAEIFLTLPDITATNGPQDEMLIATARSLVGKATVNK